MGSIRNYISQDCSRRLALRFVFISLMLLLNLNHLKANESRSFTQLMDAINQGQEAVVNQMIQSDEFSISQQAKALNTASYKGNLLMLQSLIAKGFSVNAADALNMQATPLMFAAYADNVSIMNFLKQAGADLNQTDSNGDPAINWASYAGNLNAVRWLVESKARTDLVGHGNTLQIAKRRGHQKIIGFLCEQLSCNAKLTAEVTNLIHWLDLNDLDQVKELLAMGISVNSLDETGRPLLHRAARNGFNVMVTLLLDAGAAIDSPDDIGFTPLMEAVREGKKSTINLLINRGANINQRAYVSALELTPIHLAAINGEPTIINLLKLKGAHLNAVDSDGTTAMLWAISEGQINAAKQLISLGADSAIKNKNGLSAATYLTN